MFKFFVEGLSGARQLLNSEWPTKALSLVSPRLPDWPSWGDHHKIIRLDDVGSPSLSEHYPRVEHIEEAFAFTADLTDSDRLLVNCHLGQSRSTAMMIGILIQHGMDVETAFKTVAEHRPILLPNIMICGHIDTILGLDNALHAMATEHLRDDLAATRIMASTTDHKSKQSIDGMKAILALMNGNDFSIPTEDKDE
jgi:predicted protein tyrosine phosphatase